jgi:CheY-like chemotaxis protein
MLIEKILVVDDDEVCDMLLSSLMEDVFKYCSVTIKKDGEEALAYLQLLSDRSDAPPDLIILDFNLPDMNACDFMKVYEENFSVTFPATHIIILTCHVREEDRQAVLQCPAVVAFFNKPLEEAHLLEIKKKYAHC